MACSAQRHTGVGSRPCSPAWRWHWLISVGAALKFAWTASRFRDLVAYSVLAGLGFGVLAFAVMTALVVPLSAAAFPPNRNPVLILVSLAVHMLFLGLPIALATRWRFRRAGWAV